MCEITIGEGGQKGRILAIYFGKKAEKFLPQIENARKIFV
jgi:hypothetical protein